MVGVVIVGVVCSLSCTTFSSVHQLEKEDSDYPLHYTPPSSPENSPSPTFTHHKGTLTPPSPDPHHHTHTIHLHSSPISHLPPRPSHIPTDSGPQPVVVRHELFTKQGVPPASEGGPQKHIFHSGGPIDEEQQSIVIAASSSGVQENGGSSEGAVSSSSAEEAKSSSESGERGGRKENFPLGGTAESSGRSRPAQGT